jgi:hypothetical protein
MSKKDTKSLYEQFKQFYNSEELNQSEHKMSLLQFIGSMILVSALGFALGVLVDKSVVLLQSNIFNVDLADPILCSLFLIVHVIFSATIFWIGIKVARHWDDWLWGTFAGSFFSLFFFSCQIRLNQNINNILH